VDEVAWSGIHRVNIIQKIAVENAKPQSPELEP
jgi:hypothetical protein